MYSCSKMCNNYWFVLLGILSFTIPPYPLSSIFPQFVSNLDGKKSFERSEYWMHNINIVMISDFISHTIKFCNICLLHCCGLVNN